MSLSALGLETFWANSRRVCSPSPITTTSRDFSSDKTCLSINVAWGPPKTTMDSGHASFAVRDAERADWMVGVIEVIPIKSGWIEESFVLRAVSSRSRAGQSTTVTSCPRSSRTAAR